MERNAEVVDVLDSKSSPGAFADLAGFYEDLLTSSLALAPDVTSRIREAVRRCQTIAEDATPAGVERTRLLHTLEASILEQVRGRVPDDAVQAVDVISPFFDPAGEALRRLTGHFGDPPTRVIVNPTSSLSPGAASANSPPARFEAFEGISESRNEGGLHAKIVRLRGKERSWLVAGSPNLSRSGWLQPVSRGGNLEVAVFRTGTPGAFEHLFEAVRSRSVNPSELQLPEKSTGPEEPDSTLHVTDARITDGRLAVLALAETFPKHPDAISLEVRAHGEHHRFTDPGLERGEERVVATAGPLPDRFELEDAPAEVCIRVMTRSGDHLRGRAWLTRPSLVALSADRRSYRRIVRDFSRKGLEADQDDYLGVTRVLEEFLSSLGREAARDGEERYKEESEVGQDEAGTEERTNRPSDRPIDPDRLLIDERSMSPSPRGRSGVSLGLIETVSRTLARLYLSEDEERRQQVEQRAAREDEVYVPDRTARSVARPNLSIGRARKLRDRLAGTVKTFEEIPVEAARAPEIVAYVSSTTQLSFQLFLKLQYYKTEGDEDQDEAEKRVTEAQEFLRLLRRLLDLAFSIEGFNFGRPEGRLIRAWAESEEGREAVEEALSERESLPRHFLQIATVQHILPDPNPRLVLAGLEVLGGERVGEANVGRLARFGEQVRAIRDEFGDFPEVSTLSSALEDLRDEELRLVTAARKRAPLILLERDGADDPTLLERVRDLEDPVARQYLRIHDRLDPALVPAAPGEDRLYCLCGVSLSVDQSQRGLHKGEFLQCQHCGRLLAPFDVHDPRARRLLGRMVPELAEAWS